MLVQGLETIKKLISRPEGHWRGPWAVIDFRYFPMYTDPAGFFRKLLY